MDILFFLIVFLVIILSIPAVIFLIAYLAAESRKKKQQILLKEIGTPEFHAFVRYNKGDTQDKFLKVKAFQGSGILYMEGRTIKFVDTLRLQSKNFDLDTASIKWVDVNLVNGLLKWFSVADHSETYYFNIDSGMFIFNTNSSKPTTKSVFDKLVQYQTSL